MTKVQVRVSEGGWWQGGKCLPGTATSCDTKMVELKGWGHGLGR